MAGTEMPDTQERAYQIYNLVRHDFRPAENFEGCEWYRPEGVVRWMRNNQTHRMEVMANGVTVIDKDANTAMFYPTPEDLDDGGY